MRSTSGTIMIAITAMTMIVIVITTTTTTIERVSRAARAAGLGVPPKTTLFGGGNETRAPRGLGRANQTSQMRSIVFHQL